VVATLQNCMARLRSGRAVVHVGREGRCGGGREASHELEHVPAQSFRETHRVVFPEDLNIFGRMAFGPAPTSRQYEYSAELNNFEE